VNAVLLGKLYRALAVAYLSIGANDKALENFKRVTELDLTASTAGTIWATSMARMGRYQESIPVSDKSSRWAHLERLLESRLRPTSC